MKKLLPLIYAIPLLLLTACGDDETPKQPAPIARYDQDRSIIEINEVVTFTNNSENADSFSWDFGDGTTSTDKDPNHTYMDIGDYTVILSAKTADGQISTSTTNVKVGRRVLTTINIRSFDFNKPDGSKWDDPDDGPDLILAMGRIATLPTEGFDGNITFGENLPENALPTGELTINFSSDFILTNENWGWVMFDADGVPESAADDDIIFTAAFNPVTIGSKDYATGLGSFVISNVLDQNDDPTTAFDISVGFQIK